MTDRQLSETEWFEQGRKEMDNEVNGGVHRIEVGIARAKMYEGLTRGGIGGMAQAAAGAAQVIEAIGPGQTIRKLGIRQAFGRVKFGLVKAKRTAKGYKIAQEFLDEISTMFGDESKKFAVNPTALQILVSLITICRLSFWINQSFAPSLTEAINQYKQRGYVQKLKSDITPDIMHLGHQDLLTFLCKLAANIGVPDAM